MRKLARTSSSGRVSNSRIGCAISDGAPLPVRCA